mmetsp:Transcript_27412/g.63662  ORF Transcript_27412/g.63662 Transcript_27412/m.63662 type:complete len:250 (-) Transcript_27412:546-1295(-)
MTPTETSWIRHRHCCWPLLFAVRILHVDPRTNKNFLCYSLRPASACLYVSIVKMAMAFPSGVSGCLRTRTYPHDLGSIEKKLDLYSVLGAFFIFPRHFVRHYDQTQNGLFDRSHGILKPTGGSQLPLDGQTSETQSKTRQGQHENSPDWTIQLGGNGLCEGIIVVHLVPKGVCEGFDSPKNDGSSQKGTIESTRQPCLEETEITRSREYQDLALLLNLGGLHFGHVATQIRSLHEHRGQGKAQFGIHVE